MSPTKNGAMVKEVERMSSLKILSLRRSSGEASEAALDG
jgi:hypothetical protein